MSKQGQITFPTASKAPPAPSNSLPPPMSGAMDGVFSSTPFTEEEQTQIGDKLTMFLSSNCVNYRQIANSKMIYVEGWRLIGIV